MTKIILVRPQLGENIGMVARAMLNCGIQELRLVAPRDNWPNPSAYPAAAGADEVLNSVQVYETVEQALEECTLVMATTARRRDLEKPVVRLNTWDPGLSSLKNIGILFGAEATGLTNAELILADAILEIPTNPSFCSLNLAQAVYAVCYHLMIKPQDIPSSPSAQASKKELIYFLDKLESILDQKGYFHPPEKKNFMAQNLRALFVKSQLTSQEIQSLHGVLKALTT